jgi:glutamine amidotransferase
MVGIVNVGVGNIKSIKNWLDRSLIPSEIITDLTCFNDYKVIILPGVGSAPMFIKRLKEYGYNDDLARAFKNGICILGICLGAQALFQIIEEGNVEGLAFLNGDVLEINQNNSNTGWLNFNIDKKNLPSEWQGLQISSSRKKKLKGRVFFNHNYGIKSNQKFDFDAKINRLGLEKFSSFVAHKNLIGIQFHPEKSQEIGEDLIKMILS